MSSLDARSHTARRRRVTQPYLQHTIQKSKRTHGIMVEILYGRFGPQLSTSAVVDVLPLCFTTVMDVVSAHVFGLAIAPNLTGDKTKRVRYLEAFKNGNSPRSMFWAQELPSLSCLFARTSRVRKAKSYLETEILRLCEQADAMLLETVARDVESPMVPGLYRSLRQISTQHPSTWNEKHNQLEIASEVLDHLKATGEVLSITLVHGLYELSRNQQIQAQLRSEVRKSWDRTHWESRHLPSPESLDRLPFLDAVVCEMLRLRPTVPDGQPRLNKSTSTVIHGFKIPVNVRISTYSYVLHHDEAIFKNAPEFDPHRWAGLDRNKHLWAYSVGARACLGKHMATLVLKSMLSFIYTFYETRVVDESKWRQPSGPFARLDDNLVLSFTRVD